MQMIQPRRKRCMARTKASDNQMTGGPAVILVEPQLGDAALDGEMQRAHSATATASPTVAPCDATTGAGFGASFSPMGPVLSRLEGSTFASGARLTRPSDAATMGLPH